MQKSRIHLLGIFLAGMCVLHLLIFWSLGEKIRQGYSDFSIFYTAGSILHQGSAAQLYDPALQFRVQKQFASQVYIRQGALPYNHPPFEALLFAPLARVSYPVAFAIWNLLNLAILAILPILLRLHVPLMQPVPIFLFWIAELGFFPVFIALLQGQDSILLLLLFVLAFIALKQNQQLAAGIWLGLGLFRFHLVLPLVLILLLRKKGRVILGFAVTALALGLLSVAIVGWSAALHYPHYVWNVENSTGSAATLVSTMPNLRGFVHMLLPWTPRVEVGVSIISAILLLWASSQWDDSSSQRFEWSFSLSLVTTILVSYHVLVHDLSLLLLPVALLVSNLNQSGWPKLTRGLLLAGPAVVLFLSPLQMLLWFRYGEFSLFAPVLLVWFIGISREFSDRFAHTRVRAA
ncbi:MAG TPA: glycosyltransferase family 87 protein [Terriglobales bacterium]|nr:glycosyltransferase family 87 protein [Terriglobales bacterium]